MDRRTLLLLGLVVLEASGCGGGHVDPGFYGQTEASEDTTAAQEAPGPGRARRRPRSDADAAEGSGVSRRFQRPKLIVIRAAWCNFCREAEPMIMSVYEPFKGKIDLVILDVTDEEHVAKAMKTAQVEGVSGFFDKYGARTPSVGVFTGRERGRLVHGEMKDPEQLKQELEFSLTQFRGD